MVLKLGALAGASYLVTYHVTKRLLAPRKDTP
jgi:allophanate hydrolase subunit 1